MPCSSMDFLRQRENTQLIKMQKGTFTTDTVFRNYTTLTYHGHCHLLFNNIVVVLSGRFLSANLPPNIRNREMMC